MHLLIHDQEIFERRFPDASNFIVAAKLRLEAYSLASYPKNYDPRYNANGYERLIELLKNAPACREPWFVVQLRGDFPQIDDLLVEAGL